MTEKNYQFKQEIEKIFGSVSKYQEDLTHSGRLWFNIKDNNIHLKDLLALKELLKTEHIDFTGFSDNAGEFYCLEVGFQERNDNESIS